MYQGFNYLQQKIEEYGSLQSLDICDLSLIEKASDRLSRTQTLTCDAKTFSSAGAIQKTLNLCPVLNRLEFSAEQRQHLIEEALSQFSTIDFDRGLNKKPHPLKALINSDPNDECFTSLLNLATTIPSQVESRDYEVLIAITTTSKALEYARFSLEAPYPDELCQFFASCSRLKECLGGGHIIAAEDLITPSEWACMGLEKLDIDVRELPSLDIFHSSLPIETSSAGTVLDTTKVSENQKASYATRRQVFIALARHKSLIKLKFGSEETSMPWYHRPWSSGRDFDTFTGFEFSLESGFDEVAALPRLEREGDMRGFGSAFYSDSGAEVDAGLWLASKCGSGYDK
ncbi:hypothetical protein BGZ47_011101 [Haplosporangium gracile]|nr:hypothetical protein BGZ47_011101 [Haplosporangium gracile]